MRHSNILIYLFNVLYIEILYSPQLAANRLDRTQMFEIILTIERKENGQFHQERYKQKREGFRENNISVYYIFILKEFCTAVGL